MTLGTSPGRRRARHDQEADIPTTSTPPLAVDQDSGSAGIRPGTVILLGAVTALPALAIDAYLPALPSLTEDLQTTPAATQLTLTAVLLG
ncbi:MAG TPA: Bcr/CflA family drug resistance efflux transporter, partial [Streptomyces sp.]|nr:Bcr/CflA family drug resistance efflux transporter [Streptomyces sp.]